MLLHSKVKHNLEIIHKYKQTKLDIFTFAKWNFEVKHIYK